MGRREGAEIGRENPEIRRENPGASALAPGRDADGRVHDARRDFDGEAKAALFPGDAHDEYRDRWSNIQQGFVDEPRRALEQADALVSEVVTRLEHTFTDQRTRLEDAWARGSEASTE